MTPHHPVKARSSSGKPVAGLTFATESSTAFCETQPVVAHALRQTATVGSVSPKDYWRLTCAPVLQRQRVALKAVGQWRSQADMAAEIQEVTGKASERALVGHWITGEREPYISQMIALCNIVRLDPVALVAGKLTIAKSDTGRTVINTQTSIPSRLLSKTVQGDKHLRGPKRYK